MEVIIAMLFVIVLVQICQCANQQRFVETFYLAENRALLNNVFHWKTVSTPVICGRDCFINPKCASFNYHITKHICVMNNATRAQSRDDFVTMLGSVYYDDNVNNTSLSAPSSKSNSSCMEMYQAGYRGNCSFPTSLTDGMQENGDTDTDGGGWTVIQRRIDGTVDFHRTWAEYQLGFGDRQAEFWLGNDELRDLTASGQWELRVDMEDWGSNTAWASYGEFAVEGVDFTLRVGSYDAQSTAGDSLTARHNGRPFSTKDQDNDAGKFNNCAVSEEGAWWFDFCHEAHLNGKYYTYGDVIGLKGIQWQTWTGLGYSMKKCSMKIRQAV